MELSITKDYKNFQIDPKSAVCLAIPYDYLGSQPNFFDSPPGKAVPFKDDDFIGEVKNDKGCKVMIINQNIHSTGTHTECAGHILEKDIYIHDVLSPEFIRTELVSVTPQKWSQTNETYHCNVESDDWVITRKELSDKISHSTDGLVIRTLPNDSEKLVRKYDSLNTAFFTTEAIIYLKHLEIIHLVVDLPTVDRTNDGGSLGNHHLFFENEPPYKKTITEFAFIPNSVGEGSYFMLIEIPPMQLDAAPSRPFLFKFEEK